MFNMDNQKRFDPQEENEFFADKRAMRLPVPGTIAVGELQANDHLYRGKLGTAFAKYPAIRMTERDLKRGQERYNIYCTPCHDQAGTGQGIVALRGKRFGMAPIPTFHQAKLREMPVGQIYNVIAKGVRTMPSYASQIPVRDRWRIAAYVRALQLSQGATADIAGIRGSHKKARGK
jgi:mono/diheme cytochrome c family protein